MQAVGIAVLPTTPLYDLWRMTLAQIAPLLPYFLLILTLAVRPRGLLGKRET